MKITTVASALFVLVCGAIAGPASAQTYPDRVIKIIVPFEAGGLTDNVARLLAQELQTKLNNSVVIENRPGAGNLIGTTAVVQAPPDGYTLLFTNVSHSINPVLVKSMPYDVRKDLAPVVFVLSTANVLLVKNSLNVKTLPELIALAKTNKQLTYGLAGIGSLHHASIEMLKAQGGIELQQIPYKSGAPALLGFTRGDVDVYSSDVLSVIQGIRNGDYRALVVTGAQRVPLLPEVPTIAEAGLPKAVANGYLGILAPKDTPRPIIDKLNAAFNDILKDPALQKRYTDMGYQVMGGSADDFGKFVLDTVDRYGAVLKAAGVEAQ